jgi:hypothetical protein
MRCKKSEMPTWSSNVLASNIGISGSRAATSGMNRLEHLFRIDGRARHQNHVRATILE